MKKLYTTILIIAVALFISCDEQKAEDDIKKAFTKITDEAADVVDKATPKPKGSGTLTNTEGEEAGGEEVEGETEEGTPPPALTKPAVDSYRVRVGQVATFPKVEGHSYELKQAISGVTLETSDANKGRVTATQAASGVIVVATKDGNSIDSEPIEFVDVTLTKPVLSSYRVRTGVPITFPKVLGHTYTLKNATSNVTLSDVVGDTTKKQISSTEAVSNVIIVATLDDSSEESDPIEFVLIELTKPVLSYNHIIVGQAATFPKVEGHTYRLKDPTISGVSLEVSDENTGRVTSTQAASGVVVVATLDGNSIDSEPIQFSLLHVANKAVLQDVIREAIRAHGNNVDLNYIDTSSVTDMSSLFQNNATFNGDISKWDVSLVEDMEYMFSGATAFNQNLNSWTVSSVTSMDSMFRDATAFNQPLNKWNVSKVTDMYKMFQNATSFNQSLNSWTVSSVEDMEYMFNGATAFNQPLDNWDVSSVVKMRHMFNGATNFNQNISGWAEKSGREIYGMFIGATAMNVNPSNKPSWAE